MVNIPYELDNVKRVLLETFLRVKERNTSEERMYLIGMTGILAYLTSDEELQKLVLEVNNWVVSTLPDRVR